MLVNAPSRDIYYGNLVAGPVFRELANKIYATELDIHNEVNYNERKLLAEAPYSKSGDYKNLDFVLNQLNKAVMADSFKSKWVSTRSMGEAVQLLPRKTMYRMVPNVVDMGLSDAIYLLESSGLKVIVNGRGTVRSQSILPGALIGRGQQIKLNMSISEGS